MRDFLWYFTTNDALSANKHAPKTLVSNWASACRMPQLSKIKKQKHAY